MPPKFKGAAFDDRVPRAGIVHNNIEHQRAAVGLQQAGIGERAQIDGQRAAGRLDGAGIGDGCIGDEARPGRIQKPVIVDGAAVDGGARQRQGDAVVDLQRRRYWSRCR